MRPQDLFVALVRAGGVLFAFLGFIIAATSATSILFMSRSALEAQVLTTGLGLALLILGVGLIVLAPAVARQLRWPAEAVGDDVAPPERPLETAAMWRVASRAVACLAVLELVEPASRLVADVVGGHNLAAGDSLWNAARLAAYLVAAAVLARFGRSPARTSP